MMGALSDLKWPLVGTIISIVAFVTIGLVGAVEGLTALTQPGATVVTVLNALWPYLLGLFLAGAAGVGFIFWGLYRIAKGVVDRDSRLLRSEKVVRLASYVERKSDIARRVNLTEHVEPPAEVRREQERQRLQEQYVAGELSEQEFERRLDELLDDGESDESSASGERSTQREYTS